MRRIIIAAWFLLLACSNAFAMQGMGPGPGVMSYATVTGGPSYDTATFESTLGGWADAGTTTASRSTTQHYSGSYSLHGAVVSDGNQVYTKISRTITTNTGSMTFWVWLDQGAIDYWGTDLYNIDVHVNGATTTFHPTSGGWAQYTKAITGTTSDPIYIKVYGVYAGDPGETANLYIDDVKIPIP